jgi:hypothetical protein
LSRQSDETSRAHRLRSKSTPGAIRPGESTGYRIALNREPTRIVGNEPVDNDFAKTSNVTLWDREPKYRPKLWSPLTYLVIKFDLGCPASLLSKDTDDERQAQ